MKKTILGITILILTPAIILGVKIMFTFSDAKSKLEYAPLTESEFKVIVYHNDTLPFNPELHSKGWGYDIYLDGKLHNHQPYIPTITGVYAFLSESDARTVGNFCAQQLKKKGLLCEAISLKQLDSLGIKYPTIDSINTTTQQ